MIVEGLEVEILDKTKGKDKEVVRVVEEMKKADIKTLKREKCKIDSELILKKGKFYIPKNDALRLEVILLYHDITVAKCEEK